MKSLRTRLLTQLLLLVGLLIGLFCAIFYIWIGKLLQRDVDSERQIAFLRLDSVGSRVATEADRALLERFIRGEHIPDQSTWLQNEYRWIGADLTIRLLDDRGKSLGESGPLASQLGLYEHLLDASRKSLRDARDIEALKDGRKALVAVFPIWEDAPTYGKVHAFAEVSLEYRKLEVNLRTLLAWLFVAGIGALAVAVGGSWLVLGYWLKPVARVAASANAVEPENLSTQRLYVPAQETELAQLARTVNTMLERLERAHAAERRFIGDAAHELGTPLTVMLGEIDLALRRQRSELEYREVLESSRGEIARMAKLTEHLLLLAAADAGQEIIASEMVDLAQIAREAADKRRAPAEKAGVTIEVVAEPSLTLHGDPVALLQVCTNLVDNALRHTPAGGRVTITAARQPAGALLEVRDTGEGIAPEHLPNLFLRFYRVDKGRSRAHGGVGLGLAIVKLLVEAHGGAVTVQSERGKGATFAVSLPFQC